ncbi:hypothetical protein [Roseateles sp. LKC17W]|uniref:VWA domain-containing protein n=1 Tax=Pelomonas margarita TaxID=3299031 RepID=A0ABW7FLR2_9BURK
MSRILKTCAAVALGWLPALAWLVATPAQADISLQLEVVRHVKAQPGASGVPGDSQTTLDVTLGDKTMTVTSTDTTTVYDFAARKRWVIDRRTKTRVDYSLYDTVGFRTYELRNRNTLGAALSAAKVGDAVMVQVDNEHNLSVQDKPSAPLRVTTEGANELFHAGPKLMFRRGAHLLPAKPGEARMFAQLLRYALGGHPQILSALAQADSIPAQFSLVAYDAVGSITQTVVIRHVHSNPVPAFDASAFPVRPASESGHPVDQALDRAAALTPDELLSARRRSKDELETALREGRALDAFLGMFEWSLMTGEAPTPLTADQKQLFQTNDAVRRVTVALSAKSKDDLAKAITDLTDIAKSTATKAHVLRIFEANNRAMLGDRKAAQKLFIDVLKTNPYIAGVYKDLGDSLFVEYDTPRAWRCWDSGRKMAPGFANFQAINQFETSLAARHPEFF